MERRSYKLLLDDIKVYNIKRALLRAMKSNNLGRAGANVHIQLPPIMTKKVFSYLYSRPKDFASNLKIYQKSLVVTFNREGSCNERGIQRIVEK